MRKKIFITIFLSIIYGFMLWEILAPDKLISFDEKRYLKQKTTLKLDDVNSIENYLLDQFPLRDKFRSLKAYYNYYAMQKLENNNIILINKGIYKNIAPTNYKSIANYLDYLNKTMDLLNDNNNVYLVLVPDKNYYVKNSDILQIDYNYIYDEINNLKLNNIDIRDILNLDDYYLTDTHWKEENLDKVVKVILDNLDKSYERIDNTKHIYHNFKGAYYKEAGIKNIKDDLVYLTNDYILKSQVNYLENPQLNTVYNLDNLDSFDSYSVFLDGPSNYIEIENSLCNNDDELVIFRDSFGSSIAPLLIPYYKKITLIDNRYISSKNYLEYIKFTNQDVLFLNSTLLVNESFTLKK